MGAVQHLQASMLGSVEAAVCVLLHRAVGQGHQLLNGVPHLSGAALKQAAAPHGEEGVADEGAAVIFEMVANVALGVAWGVQDGGHCASLPKSEAVTLADLHVDARDALTISAGAHHDAACELLELLIAAGVIIVVVSIQNVG